MKKLMQCLLGSVAVSAACLSSAHAQTRPSYEEVKISGSQLRHVESKEANKSFDVQLLLPASYDPAKPNNKEYPLLVVLDGQWDFKLIASVTGGLYYDKDVPEVIVCGITYPGEKPDYDALRAVDLTPVAQADRPGSGGGAKFLAFIEKELLPSLKGELPVDDSKKILLGNSLGGMFTLYAMFERPGLFSDYVSSSPAVTFADDASFKRLDAFVATKQPLNCRLFVGVGEREMFTEPVIRYLARLRSKPIAGLTLQSMISREDGHTSNKPEVYNRGLRFVFAK